MSTATSTSELLDVTRVQSHVNLSSKTILRLAREGKIPAVRVNKRVILFKLPAVIEALENLAAK